jgi:hypothetical protein
MSMRSTRGCGSLGAASLTRSPARPGGPDHRRDHWHRKEGCCQQCTAQACSSDSTSSQGESSLIRSTRCCMIVTVCTSMYEYVQVYTRMYEYVRVCISIIRGCKYSWSAHIFLSFFGSNIQCTVLRLHHTMYTEPESWGVPEHMFKHDKKVMNCAQLGCHSFRS